MPKRKLQELNQPASIKQTFSVWERSLLKLEQKISGGSLLSSLSYYREMFRRASEFKPKGIFIGRRNDLSSRVRDVGVTAVELDGNALSQPNATRRFKEGMGGILSDENWDIFLNYVWLLGAMASRSKITMVLPKGFFNSPHLSLSRITPQGVKESVTAQEIGNLLHFGFKPQVQEGQELIVEFTPPKTLKNELLPENMEQFSHDATLTFLSEIQPPVAPQSESRVKRAFEKPAKPRFSLGSGMIDTVA